MRSVERATRTVGREVAKVGSKAIKQGAGTFARKPLTVRTRTSVSGTSARVEFLPKPAGAWAIAESGADPHPIEPRKAKVLRMPNGYAMHVNHPGVGGTRRWSKAEPRLKAAVKPEIEDTFSEALNG